MPLPEAILLLINTFPCPERRETIPVQQALGRIVLSPVFSRETIPGVRISLMDGIAVRYTDTLSAQDQKPAEITDALQISTGQEVVPPFDAVIPFEEIWYAEGERYQIRRPARSGQNIRQPGEEITQSRLILEPGHRIIASDIGALLTYGIDSVEVRSLIIGLIPTGDELIEGAERSRPDQVRESNTAVIAASLVQSGIHPIRYPIVPDEPVKIAKAIRTAVNACDMVIVTAGSSAGTRDHTRETIADLGQVLFHGIAMRPGKTLLCGKIDGKPVVGLPGQPLASLTAWREVVIPLLNHWNWYRDETKLCTARTAEAISGNGGIDEFIPVSVVRIADEDYILPRPRGAAGQIQTVHSNAILHIPASKEGYREGAEVSVRMTREVRKGQGILIAGISDALTDHLQVMFVGREHYLLFRPMSAIGAAASLCKGKCHAIVLMAVTLVGDSDIVRLLRTGCPGRVITLGIGSRDGDRIILVYRDNITSKEEISPLVQFLTSEQWTGSDGYPAGYSSEGAGREDLFSPDSCTDGLGIQIPEETGA